MGKKSSDKAQKRVTNKLIKKITFGVTDALMNVLLYSIYLAFSSAGKSGPAGVYRAFDEADEVILEFNAKSLRKALYNLKQKGFISSIRRAVVQPAITKTGLARLKNSFPFYDSERAWDKNLYLITYDIPAKCNKDRNILRDALNKLKAARLQDSVYLTVYNPRKLVGYITKEYNIQGQILISTLDTNNAFGTTEDIREILWDIYNLGKINQDYELFIYNFKKMKAKDIIKEGLKMKIAFEYMSILNYDPQLPFELLPDRYLGDEAYLLPQKLLGIKL